MKEQTPHVTPISEDNMEHDINAHDAELTESEARAVEYLDEEVLLPPSESMEVIGTFSGVKPSCLIGPFSKEMEDAYVELAKDLNMACKKMEYEDSGANILIMSRDEEIAEELKKSLATNRDDDVERKIGSLLGYPETSTEYYLDRLREHDKTGVLPDFVDISGEYDELQPFTQFVLSPDNCKEEIAEYVKPLEQAIKYFTPNLYERIVEEDAESQ